MPALNRGKEPHAKARTVDGPCLYAADPAWNVIAMNRILRLRSLLAAMAVPLLLAGCGAAPQGDESEYPSDSSSAEQAPAPHDAAPSEPAPTRRIVMLGNSLTAGHTLPREEAWPAHIQTRIDEKQWPFTVVNAGVNGDTSTDGLQRIGWVLRQPAEVLVIELGGNDGLRGIPVEVTRNNLQAIIDRARELHPEILPLLAGMKLPPNYGPEYIEAFERIYPELAAENEIPLIPFLLEGVAADPDLNFPDGIHPTAEGHRRVAEVVWQTLEPLLRERIATDAE